jgi:tripartite-type tricarboxylate transporter receptor subunit TctC
LPDFVASNWFGMAAPAGTPEPILDVLAQAVSEGHKTELVQKRFATLGMLVPDMSRQQFASSLKAEAEQWQDTIKRGNISIQ